MSAAWIPDWYRSRRCLLSTFIDVHTCSGNCVFVDVLSCYCVFVDVLSCYCVFVDVLSCYCVFVDVLSCYCVFVDVLSCYYDIRTQTYIYVHICMYMRNSRYMYMCM